MTEGALSGTGKLVYAARTASGQVGELVGLLSNALARGSGNPTLELRPPPDSALIRRAAEMAEDAYTTELLGHCMRCWYLGDVFAQLDGVVADPEELFVACLLHDLALTDSHHEASAAPCFAVHGGAVAHRYLDLWDVAPGRSERVERAIASHMDPAVGADRPAAYLLHAGAHADVVGRRAFEVPAELAGELHARHPRGGFSEQFLAAMRREARDRPDSRAAIAWRLGMRLRVAVHPWDRRYG